MNGQSILSKGLELVNRDLAQLPPNTKGALVATTNFKGTITVGFALKTDNGWKISAAIEAKFKKEIPDGYVGITKTW